MGGHPHGGKKGVPSRHEGQDCRIRAAKKKIELKKAWGEGPAPFLKNGNKGEVTWAGPRKTLRWRTRPRRPREIREKLYKMSVHGLTPPSVKGNSQSKKKKITWGGEEFRPDGTHPGAVRTEGERMRPLRVETL